MARKTLMNNNKFSIAPLLIGLGTVVAINYLMPVIDVVCSAVCAKLNVPMSKWQVEAQKTLEQAGVTNDDSTYHTNACGFNASFDEPTEDDEIDDD